MIEYRRHGGNCLKGSSLQDTVSFRWNDLLRADTLTLEKEVNQQVNVVASITPPVQAPYLLKCVPDRVTDDSGAMISDVFLKMNSYRPQEGRWLSRTVLDHAGRVKLLKGRQMQYHVKKTKSKNKTEDMKHELEEDEEEEGFLTLVRFTEDNPDGKATALLNWKLFVVEVSPEEDTVLMLLLCISILKSVSEMKKQDVGGLSVRRRLKQANFGTKDWGSVMLHPSSFGDSPNVQPWYWNDGIVMKFDEGDQLKKQPVLSHSPVEGNDRLYKQGIIS